MSTITTDSASNNWLASIGFTGQKYVGTSFTTSNSGTVSNVSVALFLAGGSGSPCVARFYTDSSGTPGTQVGTDSDSHTPGGVDCTNPATTFNFSPSVSLNASTLYWLVVYTTNAESGANYTGWCGSNDSVSSREISSNGTSWSSPGSREWAQFNVNATTVSLPFRSLLGVGI